MITLTIKKERVGPVLGRHPWVFSGALEKIPDELESGELVELVDGSGNFLACGYFNSYSQIAVRLWGWGKEEINEQFFEKRISTAFEVREKFVLGKKTNACRIVNGESDLMPGLIVDKYADYLVVQFHNPGIEKWKNDIVGALKKVIRPKGIYERSDVRERKREQPLATPPSLALARDTSSSEEEDSVCPPLPERGLGGSRRDLLYGNIPDEIEILENGYKFLVNVKEGQKTGFFLDQRDKRAALQKYVNGKKVLNCFSYTGGFSVYALGAKAENVVSVDASEPALQVAEKNVQANGFDSAQGGPDGKCEFILADVKEYLADREPGEFDVIVLDPPAFVKDRRKVKEGLFGYRKINEQALRVLPPGGILVTCSCSTHVSLQDFRYMLSEAAARAGRTVQILETYTHGIDHPELVSFTEGDYLKCLFAMVR